MSYTKLTVLLILITTIIGCNSINVNKSKMHTASTTPVAIGVIGLQNGTIINSDFLVSAIPAYKQPIRVGVTALNFTPSTYEAYLQASKTNVHNINYVDSIKVKPQFLKLELLDKITTISELEGEHNKQTIEYLKIQKNAEIVSSVSMAVPPQLVEEISKAEAIFLVNNTYKQYAISLVKNGKSYKTISFTKTTIFGYRLSFFCWGENDKRKITLSDIIDEGSSCPKNTYRDAGKAQEKMNYFKL